MRIFRQVATTCFVQSRNCGKTFIFGYVGPESSSSSSKINALEGVVSFKTFLNIVIVD